MAPPCGAGDEEAEGDGPLGEAAPPPKGNMLEKRVRRLAPGDAVVLPLLFPFALVEFEAADVVEVVVRPAGALTQLVLLGVGRHEKKNSLLQGGETGRCPQTTECMVVGARRACVVEAVEFAGRRGWSGVCVCGVWHGAWWVAAWAWCGGK